MRIRIDSEGLPLELKTATDRIEQAFEASANRTAQSYEKAADRIIKTMARIAGTPVVDTSIGQKALAGLADQLAEIERRLKSAQRAARDTSPVASPAKPSSTAAASPADVTSGSVIIAPGSIAELAEKLAVAIARVPAAPVTLQGATAASPIASSITAAAPPTIITPDRRAVAPTALSDRLASSSVRDLPVVQNLIGSGPSTTELARISAAFIDINIAATNAAKAVGVVQAATASLGAQSPSLRTAAGAFEALSRSIGPFIGTGNAGQSQPALGRSQNLIEQAAPRALPAPADNRLAVFGQSPGLSMQQPTTLVVATPVAPPNALATYPGSIIAPGQFGTPSAGLPIVQSANALPSYATTAANASTSAAAKSAAAAAQSVRRRRASAVGSLLSSPTCRWAARQRCMPPAVAMPRSKPRWRN